jgi:hypothetical protein
MALHGKGIIIAAVILAVLVASFFLARPTNSPARAGTANSIASTVTIDPTVGETFAPPPPSAVAGMTAQDAWTHYAAQNGSDATTIPSGVSVQLGQLTLPDGPGPDGSMRYTANNELAYGYNWHSCPASTLTPPSDNDPCIEWLFLDANTGQQIDQTWQR